MAELTEKEARAKERICLALDVPSVQEALDLAAECADYVGTFKVGKQLHTAAGNESINIVEEIRRRGGKVFLDLKLHDTPHTVYEAAKVCTVPGVFMFNVHVAGGEAMCRKAVEGAAEAAAMGKIERPRVIGVTVLTSLDDDDLAVQHLGIGYEDLVYRRTELAVTWGLDGIVCPADRAGELEKRFGATFLYVTPGISWGGKHGAGQKQLYSPDRAVRDCSNSILILGSALTNAGDKNATALEIIAAMAGALS